MKKSDEEKIAADDKLKAEATKAEASRFLKKIIMFCFGYVIAFTITMIIIFCMKGDYPEGLAALTFGYFGIEIIVSAAIKIFEPFKKQKEKTYESFEYTTFQPTDEGDINDRRDSYN